ncbi:MAG: twin-arginine translocase TatA/TatE family subunit [Dehalococcoidia bacterium]|nr:twin-arginine translocase TatA/TatE family subunit [Dehalococcoidia bacterium]
MNILGMGFLELLVVFFIAFVVLGPERMVEMSRKAGRLVGDLRRMNSGLRETLTIDEPEEDPKSRSDQEAKGEQQGETVDRQLHEGPVDFRAWRASRLHVPSDSGDEGSGEETEGGSGGAGQDGATR